MHMSIPARSWLRSLRLPALLALVALLSFRFAMATTAPLPAATLDDCLINPNIPMAQQATGQALALLQAAQQVDPPPGYVAHKRQAEKLLRQVQRHLGAAAQALKDECEEN